ncbi:hypothetical protein ACFX1Z_040131 [Malus domestica]
MRCAPIQCFPNVVRIMVGFHNLSQFFDLDLIVNKFWYLFDIGHINGVGQLLSRHRLFDNSSKGDHDWAKTTLEINGEWEYNSSSKLRVPTVFIFDSEFGSTPKTSPDMKKVHVALGIPSEYREWRWLLSPLSREKGGMPPIEEIKRITFEVLAYPITVVEPATNEGGKKRPSSPTQKTTVEKKLKISFAACEGSSTVPKLVINLTSSKGEKDEVARSMLVAPTIPKFASSIAERIAQRRSSSMSSVSKFVPNHSSRAKSGSPLERLATIKINKVPLPAKVVPKSVPSAAEVNSSTKKKETACADSREKSTKSVFGEATKICSLLKPDLLEDMDKTIIMVADSMLLNQEDIKAAKKVARTMAVEVYSSTEKIKKLKSELAALKGSNISAPTSL